MYVLSLAVVVICMYVQYVHTLDCMLVCSNVRTNEHTGICFYPHTNCSLLHIGNRTHSLTFSMRSMQGWRSRPKSMKSHLIPSLLYSSCSRMNMWWLKNCCNFSLVKLMHSCSKVLYCMGGERKDCHLKVEISPNSNVLW